MRARRLQLLAVLGCLLAGCAAPRAAGEGEPDRRRDDRITAEEIEQTLARNAYDLVRTLRPRWLQGGRGQHSIGAAAAAGPMVYLDGTRAGEAEVLRSILTTDVQRLEYLGPTEAAVRLGLNNGGGAILVTSRRSG